MRRPALACLLVVLALSSGPGASGAAPPATSASNAAGVRATSTPNECQDGAYVLEGTRWSSAFRWWFQARSVPSGMGRSAAEKALLSAIHNITWTHNDCGLPDKVNATQDYLGWTPVAPNVTTAGLCGTADGKNVVGFGTLPSTDLAITCRWLRNNRIVEADTVINKAIFNWVIGVPAGCRDAWVVQDVATHEFGHVFGLGHVSEALHPELTMSPVILPCQMQETTLGLGDIRGLEHLYP